jgi:outer membrane protein assembly factor BamB
MAFGLTSANGSLRSVVAYDDHGSRRWEAALPRLAPDGMMAISSDTVAVATTASATCGTADLILWHPTAARPFLRSSLPHTATALTASRALVAVAVEDPAQAFPILVFRNGTLDRTVRLNVSVNALASAGGRLAIGTSNGRVVVLAPNDSVVLNTTTASSVDALQFDASGQRLVAGGAVPSRSGLILPTGSLSLFSLDGVCPSALTASAGASEYGGANAKATVGPVPPARCWSAATPTAVRALSMDASGRAILAVLSPSGGATPMEYFDAQGQNVAIWTLRAPGVVANEGNAAAAAALAPDGSAVVFGTDTGSLVAYDTHGPFATGAPTPLWMHDAQGTSSVAFAASAPRTFVANAAYDATAGMDNLLFFDVVGSPLWSEPPIWALTVILEAAVGSAILAFGYRLRQTRSGRPAA